MNIILLVILGVALLLYGREMIQPNAGQASLAASLPVIHPTVSSAASAAAAEDRDGVGAEEAEGAPQSEPADNPDAASRGPGLTLFDFADEGPAWNIVNDSVMGGLSTSRVIIDRSRERLTFSGDVSLENNGGFASARSEWLRYDLGDFDGIALRVRGDGHFYRFRVRTEALGPAISYTALFKTEAGVWQEIYIPFKDMVPLYRGFVVEEAGSLDSSSVRSFGLMVADEQVGAFELEVDWINAVRERRNEVQYASLGES